MYDRVTLTVIVYTMHDAIGREVRIYVTSGMTK